MSRKIYEGGRGEAICRLEESPGKRFLLERSKAFASSRERSQKKEKNQVGT